MDLQSRLGALPIFPLPDVVLLPLGMAPFHIFEPRYRAMLADVLAADGLLGIATLDVGFQREGDAAPGICPEVAVAQVVQSQQLPDGRSNIVVGHLASVRLVEEVTADTLYRVFSVERIDESEPEPAALEGLRAMVRRLGTLTPSAGDEAARLAAVEGMELVHSLARRVYTTPDQRRAYLGWTSSERIAAISDTLATLLAGTKAVGEA